ncbi:SRPBCC family protein [Dactylosporangium vinaceum]|uniref:SRPBCC family protein n=1 Tax=Dactylosporangium vinaceum TaxID=53362 RepID=A0ABV5MJ08_9ACTN|nr:SRPBCC family protein [Dactylosporangium vinaceum]UAB93714.1 SRPBCC family protein [Dactylosporangium vinaceum]
MTVDFRDTITIAAPAAVAGDIMKAVQEWPSWTASVSSAVRSRSGPLTVGETVVVTQPKLRPATWTVTEVDAGGFEWKSDSAPGVRNVGGHWASDNGDGTCTAELTLSFAGPLARVVTLLYSSLIRRYIRMEAEGLKRAAEAAAQTS